MSPEELDLRDRERRAAADERWREALALVDGRGALPAAEGLPAPWTELARAAPRVQALARRLRSAGGPAGIPARLAAGADDAERAGLTAELAELTEAHVGLLVEADRLAVRAPAGLLVEHLRGWWARWARETLCEWALARDHGRALEELERGWTEALMLLVEALPRPPRETPPAPAAKRQFGTDRGLKLLERNSRAGRATAPEAFATVDARVDSVKRAMDRAKDPREVRHTGDHPDERVTGAGYYLPDELPTR